jgi:hypothetical protein
MLYIIAKSKVTPEIVSVVAQFETFKRGVIPSGAGLYRRKARAERGISLKIAPWGILPRQVPHFSPILREVGNAGSGSV